MNDWPPGPAWLFCPANRPDRYLKALAVADVVVLDLEDAVAPGAKNDARRAVAGLAVDGILDLDRTILRVNAAAETQQHAADLTVARDAGFHRVMLAKAEHPHDVSAIAHEVIPLIESPRGVEWAGALAEPSNVTAIMWGAEDLVAGLGGFNSRTPDGGYRDVARYARQRVLIAAKSCQRLAVDAVHMDIKDTAGLTRECEDAVAIGFDATAAIHPSQIAVIRTAYAPLPEQVGWAHRLLAHVGTDRGVMTFEGRMVDGPIFTQAEKMIRYGCRGETEPKSD